MILVFFIYGLCFFTLGTSILLQSRKDAYLKIAKYLWILGLFALLHGINEWCDMFLLIGKSSWQVLTIKILSESRNAIGYLSFLFLGLFAIRGLPAMDKKYKNTKFIFWLLITLLVLFLFKSGLAKNFNRSWLIESDILIRYFIGFPSGLAAAVIFYVQSQSTEIHYYETPHIKNILIKLSFVFFVYALLAGLIVPQGMVYLSTVINYNSFQHYIGIPVQILRAVCAVLMMYYILRLICTFETEKQTRLYEAYKKIIEISEETQQRIGRDLHDGLGQNLTGALMLISSLEKSLKESSLGFANDVYPIKKIIRESINKIRNISKGLFPASIEKHGLAYTLNEMVKDINLIQGLTCELNLEKDFEINNKSVETNLFRIAQEAVNNAIKHAQPDKIIISLGRKDNHLGELTIKNNGQPMPGPSTIQNGLGLKTMRHRAHIIHGFFKIERDENMTVVRCVFRL